ncbi:MAG: carbon storage regulator CsrA [Acidaminobacter sp.]|uniref:carbon storage regulator CsrA n=1 Tax=Acidaminobacter sp. TaxID=1872102 RepID=UPI00137E5423|nr:carbon storage regulator CsrA [Acidaminobacter sp.]MZQ99737.1 carbon storage regulator CsrA [Acidaminobacter sp.]
MLVLARKEEESLIIDGNIEIVVLGIEDGKVKLGINAPKEVKIYRKEVLDEVMKENQSAAAAAKSLLKTRG